MVVQLRMLQGRVEYLQDSLTLAQRRNAHLKRERDSLHSTLKRCRESRDGWKTKAQSYGGNADKWRRRAGYWRAQRDLWKFRALKREVEENPTPNGKNHLARVSR
jgi:hypothetical protein